ncbi:MAG: uracil-DNA glycosylase [Pseudomonadales bacterium]|nr:uracil-DNA glycosylase [Pseudomonadales bacterium]
MSSSALTGAWQQVLQMEMDAPYMRDLSAFLKAEKAQGKIIYPQGAQIFRCMHLTPLDEVRVVILGQDPYHGSGQAEGLCFSVPEGVAWPPSLRNIMTELKNDLGWQSSGSHGSLVPWARQGVLLLNSVMTVEAGQAASHQGKGWERFTDAVVRELNQQPNPLVFMLWGRYAQNKGSIVDQIKHKVLRAAHPSPLSANRGGFFGCRHFSQCNQFLKEHGQPEIDWNLSG